jgi:hypothetical protein
MLSYEKTPTLCNTVAAFEGFIKSLNALTDVMDSEGLEIGLILTKGAAKTDYYSTLAFETPAYLHSMSEWLF